MLLAMVLLPSPTPLAPQLVQEALQRYPGCADAKVVESAAAEAPAGLALQLSAGGLDVVAMVMDVAVPRGEADAAAQASVSGIMQGWRPAPHAAHVVVTATAPEPLTHEQRALFTRCVAAIATAAKAVGVYWGAGQVTHPADMLAAFAKHELPVPMWVGISTARGAQDTVEFLTLGLPQQFGLPELLLVSRPGERGALGAFIDLMTYVVRRGAAPLAGETMGPDASTRWPVSRRAHPVQPGQEVCCIDATAEQKPRGFFARLFGG